MELRLQDEVGHSIDRVNSRPSISVLCFAFAGVAHAAAAAPAQAGLAGLPQVLSEPAPCVAEAAKYHGVNPWILRAILNVESGFNPSALNRNANGTVDVGMAQINSTHFAELAKWGIAPQNLMDGCVATYVAAWHLARQVRKYGNTWYGVASYHSVTPCENNRYAGLLWNALVAWRVVAGPRLQVPRVGACGYATSAKAPSRGSPASGSSSIAFDSPPQ